MKSFSKICIVGLGLIGASFASAIKAIDESINIISCDTDSSTAERALALHIIDSAVQPLTTDFALALHDVELVVLAIPADATRTYFEFFQGNNFNGIITDTASTKTKICAYAQEILPRPNLFIPGHPMAGSEVNGIEGARSDLFEGCHWILCPDENTNAEHFSKLHDLLTSIGARVLSLPREEHDSALAIVSHVPHIIASSLVQLAAQHAGEQETLFRLAAGGFKDSTRIAAGSPELWSGISFDNREALSSGLQEMQDIVSRFKQALDSGDINKLKEQLSLASQVRKSLPAKWVPSTDNLLEVRIPMENRKGVVAEVTTIASKVGCNIQSIDIDHLTAHSAVLIMILTDEGDIGKLSKELIEEGFTVSFSPLGPKE